MRQKNYGAKFEGNPWPILKRVLGYMLRDYKLASCVAVVCILISAISTLNGILFMQTLVDDYVEPLIGTANPDFGPLAGALMKLIAFYVVGILASFLYNRIVVIICQGAMRNIRVELFNHMQSLPIKYFDTHPHGDIMSVYTNDVDTLRQLMGQSIPQLINSSVTVVTTFASMLYMNIPLTIWTVFMVWVMTRAMGFIGSKSRKYFSVQQKSLGKVNAYIEEMMAGQKVVKVFCHEEKNLEEFTRLNDELRDSAYKANAFANIVMPVNGNLGYISYVVCIIIGAILALNGMFGLTLGTLISFIALNKSSTQPISQIGQQMNSVVMAVAGAERIFALMDEKPETDEGTTQLVNAREDAEGNLTECAQRTGIWAWKHKTKTGEIIYKKLEGDVTFDDVDFGYEPDKLVLHNIKMYATPGQKIAFVGSTGAGKTTITNLINRFYDIADGKIRYDGININKIKKADLRRSLGMVLQDTHLFTGTVLDNIRYGRPDATDEECIQAAKLANAHSFVKRLPEGYHTVLTGDGGNLSQGQRQLLAIARAAVANPPVLILDEATSSIDTRTEALVQEGMDRLMAGRTTFVIAHRLSTVKNADCIMVLEQGRIIERGNHDQLIAEKGRYYQLYTGKPAQK